MPVPPTTMTGRLATALRETFKPAHLVEAGQAAMDARLAALCARIDGDIGEDRRAAPFRDIENRR